ncbi:MAG TPA: exonuclease domain-containing protein [Solirubrobacteraceae bacterium]|nr:exonuclease domain-containing protein [Solirubrobacteraceae bacterium]
MDPLGQPLEEAEFLAVDCETNGRGGDECELTEVAGVLVGGGELHDSFSSLVAVARPLSRGIQRLTGISQTMLDQAPPPDTVLAEVADRLAGRVLVAHSAGFDRRVLRQACARAGVDWPDPPSLCTLALGRKLLPLQRTRGLAALADALGIEVSARHRALPDAQTCGRILCALLPRLRAHATTVGEAIGVLAPTRRRPARNARRRGPGLGGSGNRATEIDFAALPRNPGVYIFRDGRGAPVYVGKSVSIASRARAHFAPAAHRGEWTEHAEVVDYRETASELGALVLENRLIKRWRPPGNVRLTPRRDRSVYLRCRLEDPYPVLEVGRDPVPGWAVNVGPLSGRRGALELVEQLDSLFGLRHCPRRLSRRDHPSAYGQMGRCLSPCLGDLDPNLYRARLEEALRLFVKPGDGAELLLGHVESKMRAAAACQRYERAASLRRRLRRLRSLLLGLGGLLRATHARPSLILAGRPEAPSLDAFWIVGGRVRDWQALARSGLVSGALLPEVRERSRRAFLAGEGNRLGAHVPPAEVDEVRIVSGWLAGHPETAALELDVAPSESALRQLVAGTGTGA